MVWPTPQFSLTRFVGRVSELDGVTRLLHGSHLVTLVGAPGAGKSRLAIEVARRVEPAFASGLVAVGLSAVSDSAEVAGEVAGALGLATDRGATITAAVVDALQDAELLLLLDNCEHVRGQVADLVTRIVAACPGVRVLATSRVLLSAPGEQLYRVQPLAADLAAELFIDRAALVTNLVLEGGTPAVIDQICERLDGLPLAIELAARQARALSLPELLTRLDTELARGESPVPADREQRTLTATIGWSFGQLSHSQAALFENLSVFVGTFDLPAVTALAEDDADPVTDLATLVDHSLVLTEPAESGELRYRLLEPIRQYAAIRLAETGRGELVRAAHAQHFLEVATSASRGLMGVGGHKRYAQLRNIETNVLTAVTWARSQNRDLALQLVTCLAGYWEHRGHINAARERIEALLYHGTLSPRTRAEALLGLAQLGYRQGRYDEAIAHAEAVVDLMRSLGDDDGEGRGLRSLGQVTATIGHAARAVECCERSIEIFRARGDRQAEAWSYTVLGYAHFTIGEIERGESAGAAALRLLESAEPAPAISRRTRVGLSYAAARRGDLAAHRKHLADTIADLRLLGATDGDAEWLWSAVSLAHNEGRMRSVLRLAGAARTLALQGIALPPLIDPIVTSALADAEEQVGGRTAGELLAAGAEMTTEERIGEALGTPGTSSSALSRREQEIAMLTGQGLTNAEIADRLFISRRTVETHQEHIRAKLDVSSRHGVIAWAITGESV